MYEQIDKYLDRFSLRFRINALVALCVTFIVCVFLTIPNAFEAGGAGKYAFVDTRWFAYAVFLFSPIIIAALFVVLNLAKALSERR